MPNINEILNAIRGRIARRAGFGGGGGSIGQSLAAEYAAGTASANRANEGRYRQALGLYDQMGMGQRMGVQRAGQSQLAATKQGLINRGLSGSTILGAMERRTTESMNEQNFNIADAIARAKAGIIERRTDVGPDAGMYAALAGQAAEGANTAPIMPRMPVFGKAPAPAAPATPARPAVPYTDIFGDEHTLSPSKWTPEERRRFTRKRRHPMTPTSR